MATILDTLIFDRTQADVDRVRELKLKFLDGTITTEEQTEYVNGLKGAYNSIDLNRVGNAIAYIGGLLRSFGFNISVSPKTDWVNSDVPTQAQAQRYIQDLSAIRTAGSSVVSTVAIPTNLDNLNFESANNIERMLYDVGKIYERSNQSLRHLSFNAGRPTIGTRG